LKEKDSLAYAIWSQTSNYVAKQKEEESLEAEEFTRIFTNCEGNKTTQPEENVVMATLVGFALLILPGFAVIAFLVFATIYIVPLMTDKNLGLMDALKKSWRMATKVPLSNQVILMVLYLIIISLGSSITVAVLFAQPLATFLVLSVYEEHLLGDARKLPAIPSQDSTE